MTIRIMTFEGCPNCDATRSLVEKTVRELHLQADVESIQVRNENEAQRYGFLGSPTVQVDGQDIETGRRKETASFSCRVYRTPDGVTGVPPKDLLLGALRKSKTS
jgi:glutaredoxin